MDGNVLAALRVLCGVPALVRGIVRKKLLCLAIAPVLAVPAIAQETTVKRLDGSTISTREIDATVGRAISGADVTGAGIAILEDGKIVYVKAYGVRDKEKNLPLTTNSVMSGASFTKVAFGYMVMQLVDEHVLDLDKPVYRYLPKPLPEYERYKDLAGDERYKRITPRMLLSHTTGFPNWRAFEDDHKLTIHFQPGSRFAYSGEGIDLLQLVVETITKRPLEELMQERVFGPFGMTRSSMVWQERFDSDFAKGYDEHGRLLGEQRRTRADAAGSLLTTIGDFARFLQAVVEGKRLTGETRAQMLAPQIRITAKHQFPPFENATTSENDAIRLSYGLAWGLYWSPYGEAFFKEGHDDGWRNYAVCFDVPKTGMVIMTNSGNGEGIYVALLETVLADTFTPIEWEGFTP
jgi:CubicO group peptidase (beta-lactamase class C family)